MADLHCWTCGRPTTQNRDTCSHCENVEALRDINDAVGGAERALRRGLYEVAWEIAQQTEELRTIGQTLKSEGQKRAEEWRTIGEEAKPRGALGDAEDFLLKALGANPLDGRIYIGLANTYVQQRRFSDAEQILHRAVHHTPQPLLETSRRRLLARLLASRGEFGEARQIITVARQRAGASQGDLCYDEAQYAAQLGDLSGAVELLRRALDENPGYAELARTNWYLTRLQEHLGGALWEKMARSELIASEYDAATEEFRNVIAPLTKRRLGPNQESTSAFAKAERLRDELRNSSGSALERGRLAKNALAAMRRAIELAKSDVENFERMAKETQEAAGQQRPRSAEVEAGDRNPYWGQGPGYKRLGGGLLLTLIASVRLLAAGPPWDFMQILILVVLLTAGIVFTVSGIRTRLWWHRLSKTEVYAWFAKQ